MSDAAEPIECKCRHCGHEFRATPDPVSLLLCGDSTRKEDVELVMHGERAVVCVTDPPYSVNYDKSHEQRGGDAAAHGAYHEAAIDPSQLLTFMALVPADVMIWSYPLDRHFHTLSEAYRRHGWEFRKELVWVKDSFSFWMSAKYQQKHEPIMLAVRSGCSIGGAVPANSTTVFEYPRPKAHELHPTAKPVALWAEFIGNHAQPGEVVYEPFSGSGTTIIAAEQLGRRCFAIEISPTYVDVAVSRWERLSGKKAILALR
jgi:DNA modification methylase